MKTMTGLNYSDVYLVPKYSELRSRVEADISVEFLGRRFKAPWIPANMSSVISVENAKWLSENGYFYIMHRFGDNYEFIKNASKDNWKLISVSVGVKQQDKDLIIKCLKDERRIDYITIDIAHSDSILAKEMIEFIRNSYQKYNFTCPKIIAGNVCTSDGVNNLAEWGADAAKVGIAGGCFAAGTRILMADGSYKNIEKLMINDRIISGNGSVTRVTGIKNSGRKKLMSYYHPRFYKRTYCTHDHLHYVNDFSSLSPETYLSSNRSKLAEKREGFYGWKTAGSLSKCDCLLLPKNIDFELEMDFEINLSEYLESNRCKMPKDLIIKPTYELGYIIGAFLGDGSASSTISDRIVKKENGEQLNTISTSRSLTFVFGPDELYIAENIKKYINDIFGIDCKITIPNTKAYKNNTHTVTVYSTALSLFFQSFYNEKNEKYIPRKYFIKDSIYLNGIIDGFYDSDGNKKGNGKCFTNTSTELNESILVACYLAKGFWPSISQARIKRNTLMKDGRKILSEKLKDAYVLYYSDQYKDHYLNKDFYVFNALDINNDNIEAETYDIEVESETHSFIANNTIVHNSACSTKVMTGFHIPMFSCIEECTQSAKIPIIADGGIRENGDIAKALVAGGTMIMAGSIFAACIDAPGENIYSYKSENYTVDNLPYIKQVQDKIIKKRYYGSASAKQKGENKNVEGFEIELPCNGLTYKQKYQQLTESLSSAISYAGGKDLSAFNTVNYISLK